MSKIRSYDVFNKGDGDVISVCTMLPSRRALKQLRTVELSRITDVLRDFSGCVIHLCFCLNIASTS